MLSWFLSWIGLSANLIGHWHLARLEFRHPWALFVGLPLLVPLGWLIFRRHRHLSNVSLALGFGLTALRLSLLLLLTVILADPYLKLEFHSETKPLVEVLLDHSQSMALPMENDNQSRFALAHSLVQNADIWEPLKDQYDVRFFQFSNDTQPLTVDAEPLPPGQSTHLGDAIAHVLDQAAGRPVAGIVVLTDGQNTGGRSPAESARTAAGVKAPIFTVPTGNASRVQDVAIVNVFTSGLVSIGDQASVTATVESQGFDKRPIEVELREGDQLLDTKELTLNGREQQQVQLTFPARVPGVRALTVQIPPLHEESEPLHANNTDTAFVRVSGEKLKVLFVEGLPRWDFRFLKNAMQRDHGLGGRNGKEPDLVLEAEWRRQSPSQQNAALPATLEQLAEYHTIILGDASAKLLTPAFLELLQRAVREKGVGLIVEAGPLAMPHAHGDTLLQLLPVQLRADTPSLEPHPTKPFRVQLTPEGSLHEALRFHDEPDRNRKAWDQMPPYWWCAAVDRLAPGAAALATNPGVETSQGRLPLIAYHFAGQGKVLFLGTDSTWTWRQTVGEQFFYKFWGQSIRFVARRDQVGSKESFLEARPYRVQPGEPVQVELMAFTDTGPLTESSLQVQIPGLKPKETLDLQADPNTKGRYLGKFTPSAPGDMTIAFDPGNGGKSLEARVKVLGAAEELRQPNVNRPALEQLAALSGGRVVEPTDLPRLSEWLHAVAQRTELHAEESIWDNGLTVLLMVLLFGLDVGLRRLNGLA